MENLDLAGVFVASWYATTYIVKDPCRTSALTGQQWVEELMEGNSRRFRENMRMQKSTFFWIHELLLKRRLLKSSRWVSVEEKICIFFILLATIQARAIVKSDSKMSVLIYISIVSD